MTLATLMPYLLVAAGYFARHFDILGKLFPHLSHSAPSVPPNTLPVPTIKLGDHPILNDAVNAAIKQAVSDVMAGHIASLRDELRVVISSAIAVAMADLKPKS